jgi:hypothetical protein
VGDFNGDGNLDLAVANPGNIFDNGTDPRTVSILLGTGTGSFGAKTDFGTGISPISVAVGDFNGDGNLDLAVANGRSNTVSILLGTGTGSFGAKTDFGTGSRPLAVAVGDFNGDGNLDLAVANLGDDFDSGTDPRTVSILLGTGTGSFGAKTDFGTGGLSSGAYSVAVGDFNGDGKLDLATATVNADFLLSRSNTVSILLGTGTGSFGAKTDFGTGILQRSVAVGDFNSDGKLDLAVGGRTVSILLNTGPIGFSLGFDSPTVSAQQGTKIRVTVNINRIAGFTGNVTVTPPDTLWGINPKPTAPIATTDTSVTFKLRITRGALKKDPPHGPHKVTFTARDDLGRTIAVTLTVIVQ